MMLATTVFALFNILAFAPAARSQLAFKYHTNDELKDYLHNYHTQYSSFARLYTIGTSAKGLDLYVVRLSTTKNLLAPNVKFVGNIHGNEAIGREVLLQFLEYIATTNDPKIKSLLDSTILHILPSVNPDGFSINQTGLCEGSKGRQNANDIDLNRNFPDYHTNETIVEQPETAAIREWLNNERFSLSGAIHSGALVANYPFDSPQKTESKSIPEASLTPDDDVFQHLALTYSKAHPRMHKGEDCKGSTPKFANGITNGAKWYELIGGMGDYNYAFAGVMELTLEISCCKFPMTKKIEEIYNENRDALIALWSQSLRGVQGIIEDFSVHVNPREISLKIQGRDFAFYPDSRGRFWRILLPGTYSLQIMFNKTIHMTTPFTVDDSNITILQLNLFNTSTSGEPTISVIESKTAVTTKSSTTATLTPSETKTITTTTGPFRATSNAQRNQSLNALLGTVIAFFLFSWN